MHRDRTEKCVGNRTGKYARKRRDTEVHQKQDRSAPETGQVSMAGTVQMQKCTRNRTEKFTRNWTDTGVHQKQDRSAPETGQVSVAETGQI